MPTQQTRPAGRFSRPGVTSSPSGRFGRAPRAPPAAAKALAPQKARKAIGGLIPSGKTAKQGVKAGRKPLGLAAVVAGAAGLAFTQRERLRSKLGGDHGRHDVETTTTAGATEPTYAASPFSPAVAPAAPPSP